MSTRQRDFSQDHRRLSLNTTTVRKSRGTNNRRAVDEACELGAPLALVVGSLPGALAGQPARKDIAGARMQVTEGVGDWLTPTTDMLNDRGMMGDGVINIPQMRGWVEAQGFAGYSEVEIFSAANWWQRDMDEVLGTCIARHCSSV